MKLGRGYIPEDSVFPMSGLNTLEPSVQADPHSSPDCLNVIVNRGIVSKRRGYSYLGATLTDSVIGLFEFESLAGVKTLLAFTTKKQYKYDAASSTWVNITYQSAAVDVNWTGDETNQLDICVASGLDGSSTYAKWIIVTNGKDQPRYWDGTLSKFALYSPTGITNFKTCRAIRSFYDHVILANVTYSTGGTDKTTIYFSDAQKLLDFTVSNTTTAGIALLTDVNTEIWRLEALGDRLFIYGENSIHSQTYVGGTIIFTWEKILSETRLVSQRALVNIGPVHIFLNQENVILFDGTKLIRPLGERIYRAYRDELYASSRHFAFSFHDSARQHVYFNYPLASTDAQMYQLEYNPVDIQQSNWVRTKFFDRATSMGFFSRDTNLTYDSPSLAGVKYNGTDFPYSQGTIKGAFPVRVIGTSSGRVCLADDTISNDASNSVTSYWDTIDFTVPQAFQSQLGRWMEIEMDLKGWEVDVYYSTDEGNTFQYTDTLTLKSTWDKYRLPIDVMSKTLRVRLKNTCVDSNFYFRWLRLWVQPGGPA